MRELIPLLGGVPLVSGTFKCSAAVTLACHKRREIDRQRGTHESYMQPLIAERCYRRQSDIEPKESLGAFWTEEIAKARREICEHISAWSVYFSIPILWLREQGKARSSSNPSVPQQIFLDPDKFDRFFLREIIVHELSHVWLGLINEVAPLAPVDNRTYTLPSGTTGKTMTQVVYALCFSVAATRFYSAVVATGNASQLEVTRLEELTSYSMGCLDILNCTENIMFPAAEIAEICRQSLIP